MTYTLSLSWCFFFPKSKSKSMLKAERIILIQNIAPEHKVYAAVHVCDITPGLNLLFPRELPSVLSLLTADPLPSQNHLCCRLNGACAALQNVLGGLNQPLAKLQNL